MENPQGSIGETCKVPNRKLPNLWEGYKNTYNAKYPSIKRLSDVKAENYVSFRNLLDRLPRQDGHVVQIQLRSTYKDSKTHSGIESTIYD